MSKAINLCLLCLTLLYCLLPQNSRAEQSPQLPPEQQTTVLLQDPLTVHRFENAAGPLSNWCRNRADKTPLLLLSQNPFLQALPAEKHEAASALVKSCDAGHIAASVSASAPNPVMLPNMTLSAALEAGLFSELIWVLPSKAAEPEFSAEVFRRQLIASGAASKTEAASFTAKGAEFSGRLRNTPVRAIPWTSLPQISEPLLLHIDLSFFSRLYKNEIKTPLYPLLFQTLAKLRDGKLKVLQVSLSQSNLDGSLPLATRFVGDILTTLLLHPEQLEGALPINWQRHSDALYLENFFQNEKTLELYRQIAQDEPDNAAAKYAAYLNLRRLKKGSEALAYLHQAVAIDPMYGLEYLSLVPTARDKGLPAEALKMLERAASVFPDNHFIPLQKVRLLIDMERPDEARDLLINLQQQPWSKLYYPEIPKQLDRQLEIIKQQTQSSN